MKSPDAGTLDDSGDELPSTFHLATIEVEPQEFFDERSFVAALDSSASSSLGDVCRVTEDSSAHLIGHEVRPAENETEQ